MILFNITTTQHLDTDTAVSHITTGNLYFLSPSDIVTKQRVYCDYPVTGDM